MSPQARQAQLTAKGANITPAQRAVAQQLINEGHRLGAPGTAVVACVYAGIWEQDLSVDTTPGAAHWGPLSGTPANFPDPTDISGMAYSFYKGGKGFQGGGAIALVNQGLTNPVQIAIEVEAPSIWPVNNYATQSGYPGDAAAVIEARNIVTQLGGASTALTGGGIFGLGGTGGTANTPIDSIWIVGNSQNPDQDYYTTINQYAQAAQWYVISDGETLFIADGIELMSQEPVDLVDIADPRVLQVQLTYDNSGFNYTTTHLLKGRVQRKAVLPKFTVSPTQVLINIICEIDRFRAGDTVYLNRFGPADGIWLVAGARRSYFQPYTELTLVQGVAPLNANSGLPLGPLFETGKPAVAPTAGTPAANMLAEANRLNTDDYPYIWGGGHTAAGTPSVGVPGQGFDGHTMGFDCSGTVAAVLAFGGLWKLGTSVPASNQIVDALLSAHLVVPGAGSGVPQCTLYDNPNHIFMRLSTASGEPMFFGTADGSGHLPANPRHSVGWIPNGVTPGAEFRVTHVKQSILGQAASVSGPAG